MNASLRNPGLHWAEDTAHSSANRADSTEVLAHRRTPASGSLVGSKPRTRSAGEAARPSAFLHLTAREHEVLEWVRAGKTNRDIAVILGASPRTIEKHLERIFVKLGVETRTAAAMRVSLGLLGSHSRSSVR